MGAGSRSSRRAGAKAAPEDDDGAAGQEREDDEGPADQRQARAAAGRGGRRGWGCGRHRGRGGRDRSCGELPGRLRRAGGGRWPGRGRRRWRRGRPRRPAGPDRRRRCRQALAAGDAEAPTGRVDAPAGGAGGAGRLPVGAAPAGRRLRSEIVDRGGGCVPAAVRRHLPGARTCGVCRRRLLGGELEEGAAIAAEGVSGDVLRSALRAGGHVAPDRSPREARRGRDQRRRMIGSPGVAAKTCTRPLIGGSAVDGTTRNVGRHRVDHQARHGGDGAELPLPDAVARKDEHLGPEGAGARRRRPGARGVAVMPDGPAQRDRGVRREAGARRDRPRGPEARSSDSTFSFGIPTGADEAQDHRAARVVGDLEGRRPIALRRPDEEHLELARGARGQASGRSTGSLPRRSPTRWRPRS